MNSGLPLTPYPRNIAVISSSKAAGYQDFINHLVNNPYGYAFRITLFEAVMQGETTMASVTEALDSISEMISEFDVVVIIRGGGSTIDLSWFDSYEIAYHVTQFPLPVLTGIGHEKDQSVTDMVAWKALKTPTAVAGFIVERTMECENNIIGMAESLVSAVEGAMEAAEERLSSIQNRITATARLMVRLKEEKLSNHAGRLARASANVLNRAKEATDRMEDALRHLNPAGVLRRGFTLTSRNGTIIQSASELKQGDTIKTYFAEGTAESMVEKINKKN
jgi:exodeoxyribonuclease VII large subunit